MQPPRLAQRLFDWYCGFAKVEDLRGDMDEIYSLNLARRGAMRARLIYWRQVLSLIFSYAMRTRKRKAAVSAYASTSIAPLLRNYVVVGIRNLARQKYFTLINVAGLAVGMSISLLFLTLFISVTDYDEFHENKESIYRIVTKRDDKEFASAPEPLAAKIRSELPSAGDVVRIGSFLFTSEPQERQEVYVQGYFVDPSFLTTFTFPLVSGDRAALYDPKSILLTQSAAVKVFGAEDVLGKLIRMGIHGDFVVRGVIRDYPTNSHMVFDALASYSTLDATPHLDRDKGWSEFKDQYVYLRLPPKASLSVIENYLEKVSSDVNTRDPDHKTSFHLQALADITPGPDLEDEIGPSWSYLSFIIAGGLALLILLPACFNYTNISIARAMKRSKEVGLRKAMGGQRQQVFMQFVMETIIVTLIALAGSCLIFFVIRYEFKSMLVHAAALDLRLTPDRFFWFLVFAVFTGLIAGAIPAIHFSRLNPIDAIRNSGGGKGVSGPSLRKGLIVFQFALCLTFILSLIIFTRQYRYALNFDLGFNRENILDVELQQVLPENFRAEFSKLAPVQSISMSSGVMGHGVPGTWSHIDGKSDSAEVYFMHIDDAFISNLGLDLLAGRSFVGDEPVERTVVVNESFVKRFGFNGPSEALGERVVIDNSSAQIVGVVRDFHYWQLHAPVAPFFFRFNPDKLRVANLKIVSTDMQETLLDLDRTWRRVSDNRPFEANFLDDETFGAFSMYTSLLKIFGFLGLLAISISCLGLLGMVVFTAESKTKEVGIRKVMGATVWSITYLLSKGYLKLMAIASLFAIPVAIVLDKFLGGLEYYRVAITPLDILLGLAIMFALGVGTMASQTLKAASTNPAETLKYE